MAVSEQTANIMLVGTSGLGKTFLLASISKRRFLADGAVQIKVQNLQKDAVLDAIIKNPRGANIPSQGRRAIRGGLTVKTPVNALPLKWSQIICYDQRGGDFQSFLDYEFDAKKSQFKTLFSEEFASVQGIIIVVSAQQFFGCPHYNPIRCKANRARSCGYADLYKNCMTNNRYAVKRVIASVAELTADSNIPVTIAVTHSSLVSSEDLQRIADTLTEYLQDAYADSYRKPRYYLVDSIQALTGKKSVWENNISLPLCDILYQLICQNKLEIEKEQSFYSKFAFGNFEEIKQQLKIALLDEIELRSKF